MIACTHRIAHHRLSPSTVWLSDIDRLARRFTAEAWESFESLIRERRVSAVCLASLQQAREAFGTPLPRHVQRLDVSALMRGEPSARFLNPPRTTVAAAISDWRALDSLGDRLRLLREYLLPPRDYMRSVFAPGSKAPLGWLYVRRALFPKR